MSRKSQESEIEFRKMGDEHIRFPDLRGIVIYSYGGEMEETVAKARAEFKLGKEWEVIRVDMNS